MKIVINKCFGGFSVSEAVYAELGMKWDGFGYFENEEFGITGGDYNEYRAAPKLIAAIEKVGEKEASGSCASLQIVEIPDGADWYIDDYDGQETIHENHRSWGCI